MEANNMMAMRDALLEVKRLFDGRIMFQQAIREAHEAVNAALAAKPRNCDMLSKDEVLETLKDRSFSKEDTIEWIYSKAKGGAEWTV